MVFSLTGPSVYLMREVAEHEHLCDSVMTGRLGLVEDGQMAATYYLERQEKLLKEFEEMLGRTPGLLRAHFPEDTTEQISREFLAEYEGIIPDIPNIGGRANPLTVQLVHSAWALAVYRAMRRRGHTVPEVGKFVYELYEAFITTYPRLLMRLSGWLQFTRWQKNITHRAAVESQKREYPDNFVMRFVEGDGESFDYGYDYIECAILKFMQRQGAPELTPYLCACDIAQSIATNGGLVRTTTLALGGERCDFRYKRGRATATQWPPQP